MKSYVTERIGAEASRRPKAFRRAKTWRFKTWRFRTWRFKTWRFKTWLFKTWRLRDLHSRSAGRLAPIVAPHSEERSMDLICGLIERFQFDPHHAAVVHAPRQAHQRTIDWLFAPVGNKSAAERCVERNLEL